MEYEILFDRWEWEGRDDGIEADLIGYNCWDYLPGGYHARFASREEAQAFIASDYLGKDIDGIDAIFEITEASA